MMSETEQYTSRPPPPYKADYQESCEMSDENPDEEISLPPPSYIDVIENDLANELEKQIDILWAVYGNT